MMGQPIWGSWLATGRLGYVGVWMWLGVVIAVEVALIAGVLYR